LQSFLSVFLHEFEAALVELLHQCYNCTKNVFIAVLVSGSVLLLLPLLAPWRAVNVLVNPLRRELLGRHLIRRWDIFVSIAPTSHHAAHLRGFHLRRRLGHEISAVGVPHRHFVMRNGLLDVLLSRILRHLLWRHPKLLFLLPPSWRGDLASWLTLVLAPNSSGTTLRAIPLPVFLLRRWVRILVTLTTT